MQIKYYPPLGNQPKINPTNNRYTIDPTLEKLQQLNLTPREANQALIALLNPNLGHGLIPESRVGQVVKLLRGVKFAHRSLFGRLWGPTERYKIGIEYLKAIATDCFGVKITSSSSGMFGGAVHHYRLIYQYDNASSHAKFGNCYDWNNAKEDIFKLAEENLGNKYFPDGNIYLGEERELTSRDRCNLGPVHYEIGNQYGGGVALASTGSAFFRTSTPLLKHGVGTYFQKDGSILKGHWRDNVASGYCKIYFADGRKYSGMVDNNCPHGEGKMIYADGTTYQGLWHQGVLCQPANIIVNG